MLFQDEKALRNHICKKLDEKGYGIIGTDATIFGRKSVDILARKENKTIAIEVKRSGRRGIMDDIRKLERLMFLPEIDFFCVAVPKINLQDDILGFGKKLGVGVIGVTEQELEWLVNPEETYSSHLSRSTSLPNTVKPGEIFEFRVSVKNDGGKMARNTEIMYMPARPFRVPKGERNHKVIKELMPGKEKSFSFKIRVENNAEEGSHPLFIRVTSPGKPASDSLHRINVKKEA